MSMSPSEFEGRMHRAANDIREGRALLQKIGLLAEGAAKRRTPVKTGTLRRSVTSRVVSNGVLVGSAVAYAIYVHDGTMFVPARPFLKEGIEDARAEIERVVEEFGAKVLGSVAG